MTVVYVVAVFVQGANVRMDSSSTVDLHIEYVLPRHTGKEVGNDEISPKTSTVANMSVGEFVAMDGECQVSWRNQPLVHSECLPMSLTQCLYGMWDVAGKLVLHPESMSLGAHPHTSLIDCISQGSIQFMLVHVSP